MFLQKNIDVINGDIVAKDLDDVFNDDAFFNIFILKNKPFTKPVSWIVEEFKKLK